MRKALHHTTLLIAAALLLIACTRDRPEAGDPASGAATPAATDAAGGQIATPLPVTSPAVAADATATVEGEAEETPTPDPAAGKTFDYAVQDGDTIGTISEKFDTDAQTLRELNFLLDDNIFIGQVLVIPWKEGMTAEGAPTATPAPFVYAVQKGDSLGSIAVKFGVTPVELIEANAIEDPNTISVGTELMIPGYMAPGAETGDGSEGAPTEDGAGGSSPAGSGSDPVMHVVQPGESLNTIAADYGVDANAIAQANGITNRNLVRVGQQLIIPGITVREAQAARGVTHVVQAGEALSVIAQQYGVTTEAILALNGIDDPNTIIVGQELVIPEP